MAPSKRAWSLLRFERHGASVVAPQANLYLQSTSITYGNWLVSQLLYFPTSSPPTAWESSRGRPGAWAATPTWETCKSFWLLALNCSAPAVVTIWKVSQHPLSLSLSLLSIEIIFFLKQIWKAKLERDRAGLRRDLPSIGSLPQMPDQHGWPRSKTGVSSGSPIWMAAHQTLEPSFTASPGGAWSTDGAPGLTPLRTLGVMGMFYPLAHPPGSASARERWLSATQVLH